MNNLPVALHPTIRDLYLNQEMTKRAIAERFGSSVGRVKSALRVMDVRLTKEQADDRNRRRLAAMCKPAKPFTAKPAPPFTIAGLVQAASNVSGTPACDISGTWRFARLVRLRRAVFYLARDHYPLNAIGRAVGGRDHSTVGYNLRITDERLVNDWRFLALVEAIRLEAVRAKATERSAITRYVERLAA